MTGKITGYFLFELLLAATPLLGFFVVVYSEGAADAVNAILAVGVVVSTAIHTRKHSDVYKTVVTIYVLVIACVTGMTSLMT
ncbi:hypothetical protein Y032_0370g91 [Ancylostoma ceylanicum]|nr:hypothetical protein Y032_0370g91 [Ancylostoma ceylanicum]